MATRKVPETSTEAPVAVDTPAEAAPAAPATPEVVAPAAPTPTPAPGASGPNALQRFIASIEATASKYLVHAAGQAIALETVATHDLSKWEATIATLATAAGTSLLKKISAKIQSWGA